MGGRDWASEKIWADDHINCINEVVRKVAGRIIEIEAASPQQDMTEAIDYSIRVSSGQLACRIRRAATCDHRDLTMTTSRPSGVRSEVEKVRAGSVRWYLYAWADGGKFVDWMFVDLDVVRREGLIDRAIAWKQVRRASDGSMFVFIRFEELASAGAIVASEFPEKRLRSIG